MTAAKLSRSRLRHLERYPPPERAPEPCQTRIQASDSFFAGGVIGLRGGAHIAVPVPFGRLHLLDHVHPKSGGIEEPEAELAELFLG